MVILHYWNYWKVQFLLTLIFRILFRLFTNCVLDLIISLSVTLTAEVKIVLLYKMVYVEIWHSWRYISSNYSQILEYQSVLSL